MSDKQTLNGGCLCGAVRFTLSLPSKWCAHCHCTQCRREHGAGYVTWVGFEESAFDLLKGEEELAWYRSSEDARRGFCSRCGSSMLFMSRRWPGEVHVALGCVEGTLDRGPQAHVFFDTHVDWMPVDDSLAVVRVE